MNGKTRIALGACGALLAPGGIGLLIAVATVLLQREYGIVFALTIVGVALLVISGVCFYLFIMPGRSITSEIEHLEEIGAESLAELPEDVLKSFVAKYPLYTVAASALAGYTVMKDPKTAGSHLSNAVVNLGKFL